jgi:hypothetical protein
MKTIYFLPLIASLTLAQAPLAHAENGVLVFDVSGHKGDDGRPGPNFSIRNSRRANDGGPGTKGEPGEDAGQIEAEVGFVPGTDGKEVFIRGKRKNSPGDTFSSFEERIPTSELKKIKFIANGGKGGTGGPGGLGERGEEGDDGSDRGAYSLSYSLDGGDAEDGQDGGFGGPGGPGGPGGDAGRIKIKLAPGAEVLSPMITTENNPGQGGNGGEGGEGGNGGKGGDGGEGICEDGSSNNIGWIFGGYKDVDTGRRNSNGDIIYEKVRCGKDGDDGRNGNKGQHGQELDRAPNGKMESSEYLYADGRDVKGYELRAANWVIEESVKDGVVEPKETLKAKAVVFENTGKDPVPAANYKLDLSHGKEFTVAVQPLAPGAKVTVDLPSPVALDAPTDGNAAIPLEVKLDHLDPGVKKAPTFPVQQPVEVVQVNDLDLTSKKREGEIAFRIVNRSNKTYGTGGDIARSVKLQLQSKSGNPPLVKVDGKFKPLTEALELDVAKIAPGETRIVRVKVRAPDNWKPGQDAKLGSTLSIENSKVAPKVGDLMQIAYQIDRNDKITKNFSVKDLGVTCQYYRALWFNYEIANISVSKPENGTHVEVRMELDGGKQSPVYKIALADVPAGFLDNVLNERPFTSNQLVDFVQTLNPPGKRGIFSDDNHGWHVRSCYAAENRVGQVDPESYAAQQASRINEVNSTDDDHDSRVIHQFVNQKHDDRRQGEDAREEKKAGDAR